MKRLTSHIAIVVVLSFFSFLGLAQGLHKFISDYRFSLISNEASGNVVLVAIDAKSLKEIPQWPWPRSLHAKLIEKLEKAAVSDIAFDIDFSAVTNSKEDEALQLALKQAKGSILLPAFKQVQTSNKNKTMMNTTPLPQFKEHAWLVSVNIQAGRNGSIETMAYGHEIQDEFVPSMAAMLAGQYKPQAKSFFIDYSIQASTVPVFSYVDIINEKVNTNLLKNKKIIIGATATELGDNLYVPHQGLISGPMLQILATETLLQNRQLYETTPLITLFGIICLSLLILYISTKIKLAERVYLFIFASILIEVVALVLQAYFNTIMKTSLWHVTLVAYFTAILLQEIDLRKLMTNVMKVKLANTQQMFEQVFNDSFTGTIIANEKGLIQAASQSSMVILNLDPTISLIGKHFKDVLPSEMIGSTDQLLAQANKNHSAHFSGKAYLADAPEQMTTLEYIITLSNIVHTQKDDTNEKHIISFSFQDITAREQTETAQKEAMEAANLSNKAKTDFLANMSHELRTPLNSIIGFSDVIKNTGNADEDVKEFAGEIKNSGAQLLKVVNDILKISQIEAQAISLTKAPCSPNELIQGAVEMAKPISTQMKANIIIEDNDDQSDMLIDYTLCKESLYEILSNAVKFSPTNANVIVDWKIRSTGDLSISITDTGTGISQEEIEKVFAPFYQVDSSKNRQFEGIGIGLTKAKAYMNLHDGKIHVESTINEGTTVHLNFPKNCLINNNQNKIIDMSHSHQTLQKSA